MCRCSTDKEKGLQDYQYQIDTLKEICKKRDWDIVKVFGGYVSGAAPIEARQEILDLIAFVKANQIDFCCATEISRVSRDLITGVQIIRTLADNGVNLYLANYNLSTLDDNGKISSVTSLILTITLEISQLERQQIRTRMQMGYNAYLQRRKEDKSLKLGRPLHIQEIRTGIQGTICQGIIPNAEGHIFTKCSAIDRYGYRHVTQNQAILVGQVSEKRLVGFVDW